MHQLHNALRCFECPGHLKILSIYYVRYLKFAYVFLKRCLGQESTTCRRHTFWWMWVAWSLGHDSLSDWKTWCKERSCPALALGGPWGPVSFHLWQLTSLAFDVRSICSSVRPATSLSWSCTSWFIASTSLWMKMLAGISAQDGLGGKRWRIWQNTGERGRTWTYGPSGIQNPRKANGPL